MRKHVLLTAAKFKKKWKTAVYSPQGGVRMANIISSYETMFIVDMAGGEENVKSIIAKFTDLIAKNGTVEAVNEWGSRKLAYPINDINEGYYVIVNFKSAPDFPAELERIFGITEGIMRSIVIKLDEKMLAKKAAKATVAVEAPAEAVAEAEDAEDEE